MFNLFREKKRLLLLMLIDLCCLAAGYLLLLLRTRSTTEFIPGEEWFSYFLALLACVFVARLLFGVYQQMWRYASAQVYLRMVLADVVGGLVYMALDRILFDIPLSFPLVVSLVSVGLIATLTARFVYVSYRRHTHAQRSQRLAQSEGPKSGKIKVAIVGAGELGVSLAQELLYNPTSKYKPRYFFDNDPRKIGSRIEGIRVLGPDSKTIPLMDDLKVQEIIIALPNLPQNQKEELLNTYVKTGRKVLIYDYPSERIGQEDKRTIRDINIEDLLFREPVALNDPKLSPYYQGKTIMITGAGGSIGSEIVRQLAAMKPKELILLDVYENGVYDVGQEIKRKYGEDITFHTVIASVCDQERLNQVFETHKPEVVFHAAAHKHVPLMENNIAEAISNNVFGTLNTIDAAQAHGVERFLLISTDKAVNPTNVMGATKRLCEMLIQSRKDSTTRFVAVRFGNVLGSNGSVVPLFKKQIQEGGPVTITDKKITRYFMTIPEATQLVLRTGRRAERSEIYVLDMGQPIQIYDLAKKLISLSGFVPEVDIKIEEIGLRPGEKLYEELLVSSQNTQHTEENRIFIERSTPPSLMEVDAKIAALRQALAEQRSEEGLRALLHQLVPSFVRPEELNQAVRDGHSRPWPRPADTALDVPTVTYPKRNISAADTSYRLKSVAGTFSSLEAK